MMLCPICKKPVDETKDQKDFPFCSDRCKLIDLGRWLGDKYQIPLESDDQDEASKFTEPPDEPTDKP